MTERNGIDLNQVKGICRIPSCTMNRNPRNPQVHLLASFDRLKQHPCWLPVCAVIRVPQPVESTEFRLKVSDFADTATMYERTLVATRVRFVQYGLDAPTLKHHTTVHARARRCHPVDYVIIVLLLF